MTSAGVSWNGRVALNLPLLGWRAELPGHPYERRGDHSGDGSRGARPEHRHERAYGRRQGWVSVPHSRYEPDPQAVRVHQEWLGWCELHQHADRPGAPGQ